MSQQLAAQPARAGRRLRGHPLVTIALGFLLFVVLLQLLLPLVPAIVVAISGHELPPDAGRVPPTGPGVGVAYAVGRLLAGFLAAGLGLWLYRRVIVGWCEGRTDPRELRLDPVARRWLLFGPLLSFAVLGLTVLFTAILGQVRVVSSELALAGLLSALGMSLFAGVVEELFARGTLFRVTDRRLGGLAALVITALVFGLQHATNPSATPASTLAVALEGGVMLSVVYLLTGSLWAPIAVHFGWNFGQAVLGLPVSGHASLGAVQVELDGPQWLTGGAFGVEVSAVTLLLWMAVAVCGLLIAVRTGRLRSWSQARAEMGTSTPAR